MDVYVVRLSDDVFISHLLENHASLIDSKWPHRGKTSLVFIQDMIRCNGGLGLFSKVKLKQSKCILSVTPDIVM